MAIPACQWYFETKMRTDMKHIFTVSQINAYIRRIFDSDYALRRIFLKGEVSNCKYHSSGHLYFTLKDAKSTIRCIMFASEKAKGLPFRLTDGQMVIVEGNIAVFERDGAYQLYAKEITLSGAGELHVRYEQLKQELLEEGYFDFDRKKPLPPYPERIGIVTALTGAAIEDIKSIASRRNPFVQLYLYPAKVQGEGAAESIARGVRYFDRQGVDIIIIGRGGGSAEDLWAFNERVVADSIFEAETPVISGTGHEVDMTIADYCADVRAATPSAACELAIPDVYAVLQQMDRYREELDSRMQFHLHRLRQRLSGMERLLEAKHPGTKLLRQKMHCQTLTRQLHQKMQERLTQARHRLYLQAERLHGLSPTARLTGGYAFAQDGEGRPVTSVEQLAVGTPFSLIFSDGEASVTPLSVRKKREQITETDAGHPLSRKRSKNLSEG